MAARNDDVKYKCCKQWWHTFIPYFPSQKSWNPFKPTWVLSEGCLANILEAFFDFSSQIYSLMQTYPCRSTTCQIFSNLASSLTLRCLLFISLNRQMALVTPSQWLLNLLAIARISFLHITFRIRFLKYVGLTSLYENLLKVSSSLKNMEGDRKFILIVRKEVTR